MQYREFLLADEPRLSSMAYDAVLRNLAVIGEAVRSLTEAERAEWPGVAWAPIAGLRNVVVHEYFRIQPALILDILDDELGELAAVLSRNSRP